MIFTTDLLCEHEWNQMTHMDGGRGGTSSCVKVEWFSLLILV